MNKTNLGLMILALLMICFAGSAFGTVYTGTYVKINETARLPADNTVLMGNLSYPSNFTATFDVNESSQNIINVSFWSNYNGTWSEMDYISNDTANTVSLDHMKLNFSVSINASFNGSFKWGFKVFTNSSNVTTTNNYTTSVIGYPVMNWIVVSLSAPANGKPIANLTANFSEQSNFSVEYGITSDYGTSGVVTGGLKLSQSLLLSNLLEETTYYYIVTTCDVYKVCNRGNSSSFSTPSVVNTFSGGGDAGTSCSNANMYLTKESNIRPNRETTFTFKDATGNAVGEVSILIYKGDTYISALNTDSTGIVKYTFASEGSYKIMATKTCFNTITDSISVSDASTTGSGSIVTAPAQTAMPNQLTFMDKIKDFFAAISTAIGNFFANFRR